MRKLFIVLITMSFRAHSQTEPTKEITPELQGNGKQSWLVKEKDAKGKITAVYMVYENPNIKKDTTSLMKAFRELTPAQKAAIKAILNK